MSKSTPSFKPRADERVLWMGKRRLKSLWLPLLLGAATFPLYGIGTVFILYAIILWLRVTYVITSQRAVKVVEHYALLGHKIQEIPLSEIRGVYSVQSGMGNLLDYWNVVFENHTKLVFRGLREPEDVKKTVGPRATYQHDR
jgi:hypothetical protein